MAPGCNLGAGLAPLPQRASAVTRPLGVCAVGVEVQQVIDLELTAELWNQERVTALTHTRDDGGDFLAVLGVIRVSVSHKGQHSVFIVRRSVGGSFESKETEVLDDVSAEEAAVRVATLAG